MHKLHEVAAWYLDAMRSKIRGSHLSPRVTNNCLNVRDQVEVIQKTKNSPLPFHAGLWIVSVRERNPWKKKMTTKFSPCLCGSRKTHDAQYSLLNVIEIWKEHSYKGNKVRVILMDLWKAFYKIKHSVLYKELDAYCFLASSLKLMKNYLSIRHREVL